jgi:hypothetical protein
VDQAHTQDTLQGLEEDVEHLRSSVRGVLGTTSNGGYKASGAPSGMMGAPSGKALSSKGMPSKGMVGKGVAGKGMAGKGVAGPGKVTTVSPFLACIGSPCLRYCGHGASIGRAEQ